MRTVIVLCPNLGRCVVDQCSPGIDFLFRTVFSCDAALFLIRTVFITLFCRNAVMYLNGPTTLTTAQIVKQKNVVNHILCSIIENAIYLLVTKRTHFGTFSTVVDIPSALSASCLTSASAQFVKLLKWLALLLSVKQTMIQQ